jgi:hypothetical protein
MIHSTIVPAGNNSNSLSVKSSCSLGSLNAQDKSIMLMKIMLEQHGNGIM